MSVVLARRSEAAGPSGRPPGLPRGAPTPKDLRAAETRAARQLKAAIRSREAGEDLARLKQAADQAPRASALKHKMQYKVYTHTNEVTNEGRVLDAKAGARAARKTGACEAAWRAKCARCSRA
jgi:hypothetical protein